MKILKWDQLIVTYYSAIHEMVKVFDEYRSNQLGICCPQIRQSSIEITKRFAVLFHQGNVMSRQILNDTKGIKIISDEHENTTILKFSTSLHKPHMLPINGSGFGPGIPWSEK